jgi:hypothetical protein
MQQVLAGRKTTSTAGLGAQLRQLLPTFKFVVEKFDTIQVNRPVTDFSTELNWFFSTGVFELNFDMTSNWQVGGGEQANSAFAQSYAATMDDRFVCRMINDNPDVGLKRVALPAARIHFLQHSS